MSKTKGFLKEFKEFAIKGNMMDLAVGVIVGAAFGKIVDSLVKDVIMPVISWIIGGKADFTNFFIVLSRPADYSGPETYADLTKAGASLLAYGNFITILINFIILAFVVFLIVKFMNKLRNSMEKPAEEAPAEDPADVVLLKEIRDLLKK